MTNVGKVLFSGYAKLPTGITASEIYRVIGIIVVVDMETKVIIEADCTLATGLARKQVCQFFRRIISQRRCGYYCCAS